MIFGNYTDNILHLIGIMVTIPNLYKCAVVSQWVDNLDRRSHFCYSETFLLVAFYHYL